MKKLRICLIAVLVLSFAGTASAAVVGEYLFATDGSDTSGYGNNGAMVNGAAVVADPLGIRGNVLDVSANNGSAHMLVADNAQFALGGGAGKLDFWVLNDGVYGNGSDVIIENEYDDYTVQRSGSTDVAYSKWNGIGTIIHTVNLYDGQWHHIVTSFNEAAGTQDYVIDGIKISGASAGTLNQSAGDLYVGAYSGVGTYGGNYSWHGYIDDLVIHDIPEPATLCLLGLGGLLLRRKRA